MQGRRVGAVIGVVAVCVAALSGSAVATGSASRSAAVRRSPVVTARPGHDAFTVVRAGRTGEALLDLTAAAPGVSWVSTVHTSTVLSVSVDGRYALDLVVPTALPVAREVALGRLTAGRHRLGLHVATDRSPGGGTAVVVTGPRLRVAADGTDDAIVLAHAPVLYGRDTPAFGTGAGGPFQNASTDSPLLAFHTETPVGTAGHRVLEYSIVWSNEDGGTSPPALMARWGRHTDIEWIYRVEVDAAGRTVPGTGVYQGAAHATSPFAGTYEADHPLLQTCTVNNNVCDVVTDPMRFAPSAAEPLDAATVAREQVMDRHPWTYAVMAAEARREGRVAADPPFFSQTQIADPRDYLYLVVRKTTAGVQDPNWVGLSIGVRLRGSLLYYRSDQLNPTWSLERDGPVATTVRLPPGTSPADISEIDALRVGGTLVDPGYTVSVTAVNRAFFLGRNDRPQRSFLSGPVSVRLTQAAPLGVLYRG